MVGLGVAPNGGIVGSIVVSTGCGVGATVGSAVATIGGELGCSVGSGGNAVGPGVIPCRGRVSLRYCQRYLLHARGCKNSVGGSRRISVHDMAKKKSMCVAIVLHCFKRTQRTFNVYHQLSKP